MFKSKELPIILIVFIAVTFISVLGFESVLAEFKHFAAYNIGRSATHTEIQTWNIDIAPNGDGLPSGRGAVTTGATIYANTCASCHGASGTEGPMPKLVGGQNTLASDHPLKTVGSYWPFATTLFDYIYRAMPLAAPQSLSTNEVYAVTAWILFQNEIIEESLILDADTLPTIKMPNRNGFVLDPRPDVPKKNP